MNIIFATIALLATDLRIGEAQNQHLCKCYLVSADDLNTTVLQLKDSLSANFIKIVIL